MSEPWTYERLSQALFTAWTALTQGLETPVADLMPVPGDIGLRGRFHYLADAEARAGLSASAFTTSWERWSRQLDRTREGDAALIAQDIAAARAAFEQLAATHEPERVPVAVVDAFVGLADAERQVDNVDAAIAWAQQALEQATQGRYRFGRVRALTSLGYLSLRAGSAQQALEFFTDAEGIATDLDERLYRANARAGVGEALARLRKFNEAKTALADAGRLFAALNSPAGVANAAQHLGDVHRRLEELVEAAGALSIAADASAQAGLVIGEVNAADALGEVLLARGELEDAVAAHTRAFDVAAQHGYLRGVAHAYNGLARCAWAVKQWAVAAELFEAGGAMFTDLDDPVSTAVSLTGQAKCAEQVGDAREHLRLRLAAVAAVESVRFAQPKHAEQQEYSERFTDIYWHGMRAAIVAADGPAFVSIFEAIAGRRLAAMLHTVPSSPEEVTLLSQLLARANARPLDGPDLPSSLDRHSRRAQLLGRLASRGALPGILERALDDAVTALVRPFDPASAPALLAALPSSAHALLMAPGPGRPDRLVWLWRAPTGQVELGITDLEPETLSLIRTLADTGLAADMSCANAKPLSALLPNRLRQAMSGNDELLLIPVGDLWSVPWPAVPIDDEIVLGETIALTVAPSASVAVAVSSAGALPNPATVTWWTGPEVTHQGLRAYEGDSRVALQGAAGPSQARTALTEASDDLVVVFAHGRPAAGVGHYLDLGDDELLTPADLLTARTPATLALISCWGARTPTASPGDPLTLATLALLRGTATVLATNAELADDPASSAFVNDVLHFLLDRPLPKAVLDATRRYLSRPGARSDSIIIWAPLLTIGGCHR